MRLEFDINANRLDKKGNGIKEAGGRLGTIRLLYRALRAKDMKTHWG